MRNIDNCRLGITKIGIGIAAALLIFTMLSTLAPWVKAADPAKNQLTMWRAEKSANSLLPTKLISTKRVGIAVLENLVKVQDTSFAESWIYNLDTKRFWVIQYRGQIFAEGTLDDLKKYHEQRNLDEQVRLEQDKKNLGSLDEQARNKRQDLINQRLAFLAAEPKRFKAHSISGETLMILGWPAKPAAVKLEGNIVENFWVTDSVPMPASLRRFFDMMAEIDPTAWKVEAALSKIALRGESDFGGIQRSWEAQSILPGSISPNEFLIPSNFSKVEFPGGLAINPQ